MAISNQFCNPISVRLDETNYPTWVFQMHHYLRGHGLLKYVDGSYTCPPQFQSVDNAEAYEKWLEQDSLVISLITTTLSADALTLVIGCQSAMEVWLTLRKRYAPDSEFHIMQLKSAMQSIQKGSDSIEKYLLKFKSIRDQLAIVGVEMSDQDVMVLILAGLPSEYGHTRQIIRGKNNIDLEELRSLLLSAESEIAFEHKALPLSSLAAMIALNNLANSSQSVQYGIPSTGISSHAVFPSQYAGNCSLAPPLHTAASNVGFLPNVTYTNVISGMPAYNHFNTSSSDSNIHLYNAPSPVSTTHFGFPLNSMISSSAFNVPTAPPNCQQMLPFTSNISLPQSIPNSGYMLNNSVGNGNYVSLSASSYGYAPQKGNSMAQNGGFMAQNGGHMVQNGGYGYVPQYGGFMAQNGGHMVQNGGYGYVPQYNYSQQQGFSNNNGAYSKMPLQQGSFSQAPKNSCSEGGHTEDNMNYPNFPNKGANYSNMINDNNRPRNNNNRSSYNNPIVCQICEKPGHSAYKCFQRNSQPQNGPSSSTVVCQICKRPSHVAKSCRYRHQPSHSQKFCDFNNNYMPDSQVLQSPYNGHNATECLRSIQPPRCAAPKHLSASICTQPHPSSIATQPNNNSSQSQVVKPHLQQVLLKKIEILRTPRTCRQACESTNL